MSPVSLRSRPGYKQFDVSVSSADGAPVGGLKASDFAARCGSRPCPIAYFHEDANLATPVSIVVVEDASSSMYAKLVVRRGDIKKAYAEFDDAVGKFNQCDEAALVIVGGEYRGVLASRWPPLGKVTLAQPFTTDSYLLLLRNRSALPHGEKRLAEGIKLGLWTLQNAHYPDRALVVVTDGLDQAQVEKSAHLLVGARKSGIRLWVIGVGDPYAGEGSKPRDNYRLDRAAIRRLAAAGGGQALFAKPADSDNAASTAQALREIAKTAGQGYSIGVVAPAGTQPDIALAKPLGTLRAGIVPSHLLAEAADLRVSKCWGPNQPAAPPPAVASKPGYTQLTVSASDSSGKAVHELKASDFAVHSGGHSMPIVYFRSDDSAPPKSIVVAIDTSGSMQTKLPVVKREFAQMLTELNPCDEVALFAFAARPFLLQRFTTRHQKVIGRLSLLHAYGQTAIYDTLEDSLEMLRHAQYRDRAIVLVTDGYDDLSSVSRDSISAESKRNGVPIYVIGIGKPGGAARTYGFWGGGEDLVDKYSLDAIASASGGRAFIVPPMSDDEGVAFKAASSKIAVMLNGGYELGFVAAKGKSAISVSTRPGVTVHVIRAAHAGPRS